LRWFIALVKVSEMEGWNRVLEVILNCLDKGILKDIRRAIKVDAGIFAKLAFGHLGMHQLEFRRRFQCLQNPSL
jgi:hypothetical protein